MPLFSLCITLPLDGGQVYSSALIVGGFCHGWIYVTGMSYVHIRAGSFRVQRIAFLHIVYLLGVASTAHWVHLFQKDEEEPRDDGRWENANLPIAYLFFGYSGAAIIIMVLHFLFQGRLYESCSLGDEKMALANGRNDNFKSTLGMPVIQGIAEKPSYMNQFKVMKLWLSGKLTGGLIFNNLLIGLVFYAQSKLFTGENEHYGYLIHYIVIVGVIFGYFASFVIEMKWMFIPATFLHCTLLIVAMSLYTTGRYIGATVFMWLFYIIAGSVYFIPDIALMETAPVAFYETLLGIGYCFEAVPLMIATYMTNQYLIPISTQSLWISGSICIAGLVLAAIGMIFWHPNTFRKGLLDIQYMLLYPGTLFNITTNGPEAPTVTINLGNAPPLGMAPPGSPSKDYIPKIQPITPVQPSVHQVDEVPYPEVHQNGIQAAVAVEKTNGAYPGPPGAGEELSNGSAKTAIVETTDIHKQD